MGLRGFTATTALLGSLAWCGAAAAAEPAPGKRTHTLAPNADYQAGPVHRMLFGGGYRKLWTTPIEVEVLDLATFSGGLEAEKKGGGKQTKSLTLEAKDGREWKFRSIDKDPTAVLPKALQRGYVDKIVQDQISASLPANALVTDALAIAAGLVTVPRRLVVLPDDARLGEFRQEFAGMLGMLEEDPQIKAPVTPGFERFTEILEMPELWERMDQESSTQIDAKAYLRARLFDLVIGDYDRHKDQWDFGKDRETGLWIPIPKDRDLAFVRFDGLVLDLIRPSNPRLVDFEDSYPSIFGLVWQARYLDHRHLSGLEWRDWEAVAIDLRQRLTNPVIDEAVRQLPPEFHRLEGAELARHLKARRDRLAEAARRFYAILAREPEIHASNQDDTLEVVRRDDGGLDLVASGPDGPFLKRTFSAKETDEVRVFLKGGDDRAVTHGEARGVKLRVVGGPGNDVLDDGAGGRSRFYDDEGENRIVKGEATKFSDRPYEQPTDRDGNADRDWGGHTGLMPWVRAGGGRGVLLGLELSQTGFGFRKHPWGHRHSLRAAYSTRLSDFGGHYTYESLRTDNRARFAIDASVSDLDLIRFHGFGNDTVVDQPDAFYEVTQRQYSFAPSYRLELDPVDVHIGPVVKFATTKLEDRVSLLAQQRPYGSDDFGQVGAQVRFEMDRRDRGRAPTRGVFLATQGSVYPKALDVEETFGEVRGQAAAYLTAPVPLRPTLALRAGGQRVWGRYPFHEAAFLGGADTVRGLRSERYAGDASAYGNAELRLAFFDDKDAFVSGLGVFGLADGGRVWLENETSDRWHHAFGGGVWMSVMKPGNVWSLAVASSEGRVRVYLEGGFMF